MRNLSNLAVALPTALMIRSFTDTFSAFSLPSLILARRASSSVTSTLMFCVTLGISVWLEFMFFMIALRIEESFLRSSTSAISFIAPATFSSSAAVWAWANAALISSLRIFPLYPDPWIVERSTPRSAAIALASGVATGEASIAVNTSIARISPWRPVGTTSFRSIPLSFASFLAYGVAGIPLASDKTFAGAFSAAGASFFSSFGASSAAAFAPCSGTASPASPTYPITVLTGTTSPPW